MRGLLVRLLQISACSCQFQLARAAQLPLMVQNEQPSPITESSQLLSLHKHLVEIESITGNEKEIGEWLTTYLQDHGLTVEKQEVAKDRFNIFAYFWDNAKTKLSKDIESIFC